MVGGGGAFEETYFQVLTVDSGRVEIHVTLYLVSEGYVFKFTRHPLLFFLKALRILLWLWPLLHSLCISNQLWQAPPPAWIGPGLFSYVVLLFLSLSQVSFSPSQGPPAAWTQRGWNVKIIISLQIFTEKHKREIKRNYVKLQLQIHGSSFCHLWFEGAQNFGQHFSSFQGWFHSLWCSMCSCTFFLLNYSYCVHDFGAPSLQKILAAFDSFCQLLRQQSMHTLFPLPAPDSLSWPLKLLLLQNLVQLQEMHQSSHGLQTKGTWGRETWHYGHYYQW